jgi:hypothetical protein
MLNKIVSLKILANDLCGCSYHKQLNNKAIQVTPLLNNDANCPLLTSIVPIEKIIVNLKAILDYLESEVDNQQRGSSI